MSRLQARSTEISTQWRRRRANMLDRSVTTLPKTAISASLPIEVYSGARDAAIRLPSSAPGLMPTKRESHGAGSPLHFRR